MKQAKLKINRMAKVKICATSANVKITMPKQVIGNIALEFIGADGNGTIINHWELVLQGNELNARKVL